MRQLLATLTLLAASNALAFCPSPPGDLNGDWVVNVLDAKCLLIQALAVFNEGDTSPTCLGSTPHRADLNCDGQTDVTDVLASIKLSLEIPLSPAVDADGDLCFDSCEAVSVALVHIVTPGGAPVSGAAVEIGDAEATTDSSGVGAIIGEWGPGSIVRVSHPAHGPIAYPWNSFSLDELGGNGNESEAHLTLVMIPTVPTPPTPTSEPIVAEIDGTTVSIPAGGVVLVDGSPAPGPIELRLVTVDIATTEATHLPGPLNALDLAANPAVFEPLTMTDVALFSGDEPAMLAPGVAATLQVEIPDSSGALLVAGQTLSAWHFDLDSAQWLEETAGLVEPSPAGGLVWTAEVEHFSWWAMGGEGMILSDADSCASDPALCSPGCVRANFVGPDGEPLSGVSVDVIGAPYPAYPEPGETLCFSATPGTPTSFFAWGQFNGSPVNAWMTVTAPPAAEGCGGDGCLDLGTVVLTSSETEAVGTTPGCLCDVHGVAGSVVGCPFRVAAGPDATAAASALGFVIAYDSLRAKVDQIDSHECIEFAGTSWVWCGIPVAGFDGVPIATDPFFFLGGDLKLSNAGAHEFLYLPHHFTAEPSLELTDAETDQSGMVISGDPTRLILRTRLTQDVPKDLPVSICLENLSAIDSAGRQVAAEVQNGVIITGQPLVEPKGTQAGCSDSYGDVTGSYGVENVDWDCTFDAVLEAVTGNPPSWSCAAGDGSVMDVDCSGDFDLVDLYAINLLSWDLPLPATLDANENGCVDRCEAP